MTPLHWACEHNHVDIVKILLRAGAKIDIKSKVHVKFALVLTFSLSNEKCTQWQVSFFVFTSDSLISSTEQYDLHNRRIKLIESEAGYHIFILNPSLMG